ncbi:MAG: hypothetical protein E7E21_09750 [Peptostreptococcaceae bacterium]|nr:hypothetical protein [Peptostreptococcaceae bacterium]
MNNKRRYKGFNKRRKINHIRVITLIFCLSLIGVYGYTKLKNSEILSGKIFNKFNIVETIGSRFKEISFPNIFKSAENEGKEEYEYSDISDEIEKVKNDKETSSTEENSNVQVATIDGVTLYTIQVASIGEGQDLKSVEEKLTSSKIPYSVVEVDGVKKVQTYSSFNEKVTRENLDDVRKVFNDAFISELSVPVLSLEYTSKYSYIEGISSSLNSLMASYKEEAEFWEGSKGDVDLKEYNNILTKRLDIVEKIQENAEKIDYTEMNIFKENLIKYAKNVKDNINQSSKNANEDNSYLSKSLLLSSIQEYYTFINSIKTS